jgi:hypothetical protein
MNCCHDGLTDCYANDLGRSMPYVWKSVAKLCIVPGTNFERASTMERMRAVANADKHDELSD